MCKEGIKAALSTSPGKASVAPSSPFKAKVAIPGKQTVRGSRSNHARKPAPPANKGRALGEPGISEPAPKHRKHYYGELAKRHADITYRKLSWKLGLLFLIYHAPLVLQDTFFRKVSKSSNIENALLMLLKKKRKKEGTATMPRFIA